MKRFHVHLSVADLAANVGFYSRLFGAEPSVRKPDYAKWMLDDPRVNFAISTWNPKHGVNHLGLQVDTEDELADIGAHFARADASTTVAEPNARCCYAVSDKHWVQDPQGIAWEAFHTLDAIPTYGDARKAETESACCGGSTGARGACRPQAAESTAAAGGCCA